MPERIQLSRRRGWRLPPGAVSVARPGPFGNPFAHADRAISVRMFRTWLLGTLRSPALFDCRVVLRHTAERRRRILQELPYLRGRTLACWCPPGAPCHADVLIELANAPLLCERA